MSETGYELVRELTPADLALVSMAPKAPANDGPAKIRAGHHAVARALAHGLSQSEVAVVTGYSPGRISILQDDPTFNELVATYKANLDLEVQNLAASMGILASEVVEEMRARLETDPAAIGNGTLTEWLKATADRTGFGPAKPSTTINVNVGIAGRLQEARRRAGLIRETPTLELAANQESAK